MLERDYDTLLALAGAADIVVREYLQTHAEVEATGITLFRAAQVQGFEGDLAINLMAPTTHGRWCGGAG